MTSINMGRGYTKPYEDFDKREIPTQRRARNTIVTEMKMVQAFFRELEDMEEIEAGNHYTKLELKNRFILMCQALE